MTAPKHVGVILDGNRRFAKKLMMQPWKGHEWGAEKVEKLIGWAQELKISELTLYAFSMQNFNRPQNEFDYLMKVFEETFEKLVQRKNELDEKGIRIRFIGRIHLFPPDVHAKMEKLMKLTKNNNKFFVNFAMAYGGREELIDAVKEIGRAIEDGDLDPDKIDEKTFSNHLYIDSDPDLIIRTGGDHRTSNFLAWQSVYSEWLFLEKQ